VIRWDESKKWQKKLESLKKKLTEKNGEVEDYQKQMKSIKDTVERAERDRGLLQSKLRAAQRTQNISSQSVPPAHLGTVVQEQSQPQGGGVGSAVPLSVLQLHADQVHQLKSKIAELENQLKLSTMKDESNETEKRMLHELNLSVDVVKRQCVDVDAGLLAGRVEELQTELLACQKQNIRLKFELEQAVVTQPRMKARITDLEDYNAVLKSSLAEAEKNTTADRPIHSGGKDPTSKSALELECVITAMKKVIREENSKHTVEPF
jgi:centrosomal protein CEP290